MSKSDRVLQHLVTEAELSRAGWGDSVSRALEAFLRGFLSFRAGAAENAGQLRTRAGRREMITLKHLMAAHNGGPGPYMANWPRTVLFIVVIAVLAGSVAIWTRSRYHP